ncbi:hypothetical protein [Methylobacillus sp.]|uniref:hypothetical protein n=1 Tax=Methylobacillus sp. TaxID=56818 RepID=UPI002FE13D12
MKIAVRSTLQNDLLVNANADCWYFSNVPVASRQKVFTIQIWLLLIIASQYLRKIADISSSDLSNTDIEEYRQ